METSKKTTPKKAEKEAKTPFFEAFEEIVSDCIERSQAIVRSRYGISGKKNATLEEIGRTYGITRERVRQIIREVYRKAKEKQNSNAAKTVMQDILFTLEAHSGIIQEDELIALLGKGNTKEEGSLRFFLDCFDGVKILEVDNEIKPSVAHPQFKEAYWRAVKNSAIAVLKKSGEPITEDELFEKISSDGGKKGLDKKMIFDYLAVSVEVRKNNFGKWGLAFWKDITPKGTREKSYMILKEAGKPLHFREIAQGIDKYKLNKNATHPQTVHNELIKDDKFVLVGRGTYALVEWGYKKGTVKDVIEDILSKAKTPLNREAILKEVLKVRYVKKSTIIINLNNFFSRSEKGTYSIPEKK